jgi:hypothetical protein
LASLQAEISQLSNRINFLKHILFEIGNLAEDYGYPSKVTANNLLS